MYIEVRPDGEYIVTEEKINNKELIIKLNKLFHDDILYKIDMDTKMIDETHIQWYLRYDDNKGLIVSLESPIATITQEIEEDFLYSLINCYKEKKYYFKDEYIYKIINDTYNKIFYEYLQENYILYSSQYIVEGLVEIISNNKIIGYGKRCIIDNNLLTVCELLKKDKFVTRFDIDINIYLKDKKIQIVAEMLNPITNDPILDYKNFKYIINNIVNESIDIEYNDLDVPTSLSYYEDSLKYILGKNTHENILKQKNKLKKQNKLIDINDYMINEYLI